MKEKILEAFRDLGFKLEEEEGMGYCFNYEGLNLLYMYNESDEEFLNIPVLLRWRKTGCCRFAPCWRRSTPR